LLIGLTGISDGGTETPDENAPAGNTDNTSQARSITTITVTQQQSSVDINGDEQVSRMSITTVVSKSHSHSLLINHDSDDTDMNEDALEVAFDNNEAVRLTQRSQLTSLLHDRKKKNRDKMVKMHNNKRNKTTVDFEAGDIVSVLIPAVDRGHCDNKRLPCIIKEAKKKPNHVLYILQCKYGILEQGYLAK